MKQLSQKESVRALNNEKVDLGIYLTYKKDMQRIGKKIDIMHAKAKKQPEMVKEAWHGLNFYDEVKPRNLFLANLYIHDDAEFANKIKEALSFGVKPEHIVPYLNLQGYNITETVYHLKLAEFVIYQKYYERTNNWYMIEEILEKTGAGVVSIEALREFKQEELIKKASIENQTKKEDYQKIISFPAYPNGEEKIA